MSLYRRRPYRSDSSPCEREPLAIDVLSSLSRVMSEVVDDGWQNQAARMRNDLALIRDAEDLIRLGAYTPGASAEPAQL